MRKTKEITSTKMDDMWSGVDAIDSSIHELGDSIESIAFHRAIHSIDIQTNKIHLTSM